MTVRWGIIGCGDVCEKKSGPALQRCECSEVVCVMRRDAALAADFAKRHGIARSTGDAEELINSPDVDAVYIATPVGSHHDLALRVAAAGKHCLVEKPIARSHAEATRMLQAFGTSGKRLFTAYYRRCLPWFVQAREIVTSGGLGQVTSVSLTYTSAAQRQDSGNGWRVEPELAGGGLFMDLGSHALDLVDYLLGPIDSVQALAANLASNEPVEDNIAMSFRCACGALGVATWDFAAANSSDVLQIRGTGGVLSMPVFGRRLLLECQGSKEVFEPPAPAYVHESLVKSVIDDLLGRGACPSTGETAARTAAVMDQVLTKYYGGRDDAFWARPQTWPGRRVTA